MRLEQLNQMTTANHGFGVRDWDNRSLVSREKFLQQCECPSLKGLTDEKIVEIFRNILFNCRGMVFNGVKYRPTNIYMKIDDQIIPDRPCLFILGLPETAKS